MRASRLFLEASATHLGTYKGSKDLFRQANGQGELNYKWLIYKGGFKSGRYHGIGKISYADGAMFRGEFSNNKRNGLGELTLGTYYKLTCVWKDNRPEGYG